MAPDNFSTTSTATSGLTLLASFLGNRISEIANIAEDCRSIYALSNCHVSAITDWHVLFMDLVGYSMLLLDEQRQYMEQLTEIVRRTEQVRSAKEVGKLIRLPVGDGMALVFFDSAEAPVRCAIEISRKLKEYPQLKLRMGI